MNFSNSIRRSRAAEITLERALEEARALAQDSDFDADGVHPLARSAIQAARAGNIRSTCIQWRIVLEALDHAHTPAQSLAARHAASVWVNIASFALLKTTDGRILADARRRGDQLAAMLLIESDHKGAGLLFFQLGAMILDPYIERRDSKHFLTQVAAWGRQGVDTAFELCLPGDVRIPPPAQALSDAAAFLARSAGLRGGREKGKSLKALAEACYWHGVATGSFDRKRIEVAMRDALELLDPTQDAIARNQPEDYACALGLSVQTRIEGPSAEMLVLEAEKQALRDPRGFIHALIMTSKVAPSPDVAIANLLRGLKLAGEVEDEEWWIQLVEALSAYAWRKFDLGPVVDGSRYMVSRTIRSLFSRVGQRNLCGDNKWLSARDSIRARAKAEAWPPQDLALALLAVAMDTSKSDREDVGLDLIADALTNDLSATPEVVLALETGRAGLGCNLGATHVAAKRWEPAFCQYLQAVKASIGAHMPELARVNFRRAQDVFPRLDHPGKNSVIKALATSLPLIQSEFDATEGKHIADIWRRTMRDAAFLLEPANEFHRAFQAAKGASVALARQGYPQRPVFAIKRVQNALNNWRTQKAIAQPASSPQSEIDQERLLAAYADDSTQAGATPSQELDNLARQFDRTLISELARSVKNVDTLIMEEDEIRARLPEKTVLVSFSASPTAEWSLGFVTLLVTRKGIQTYRTLTREPMMELFAIDGIHFDGIGPLVANLRRGLLSDEHAAAVTDETQDTLMALFGYAFGSVKEKLADLHLQGYRHLCVNPYGAFHFCPIALFGDGKRLLADDWIVTSLPALSLLRWQESETTARSTREGASVFGLSFAGRLHGLDPLPQAVEETNSVAKALRNADVFLEADATAANLNAALTNSRFVHLATHGSQNAAAPAFQTLFLHPNEQHDGEYYAYEVLQIN
jgi:hypothetical protein